MPRINELTPRQRQAAKAKRLKQRASKQVFHMPSCTNSGLAILSVNAEYAVKAEARKPLTRGPYVDRLVTPPSAGFLAAKAALEQRTSI